MTRTRAYDHWNQMHAAVDPHGVTVWCSYADQEARTNEGFCQYCGSTDHIPVAVIEVDEDEQRTGSV